MGGHNSIAPCSGLSVVVEVKLVGLALESVKSFISKRPTANDLDLKFNEILIHPRTASA